MAYSIIGTRDLTNNQWYKLVCSAALILFERLSHLLLSVISTCCFLFPNCLYFSIDKRRAVYTTIFRCKVHLVNVLGALLGIYYVSASQCELHLVCRFDCVELVRDFFSWILIKRIVNLSASWCTSSVETRSNVRLMRISCILCLSPFSHCYRGQD